MPYIGNITQDFNVSNAMLDTDSVTSIKIVDGTIEGADIAANLDLSDSQKIRFGTGNDLEIFHDGSVSRIKDVGTGGLFITTDSFNIKNPTGEDILTGNSNAAVELYHDNVKKLQTVSSGIEVLGTEGVNAEFFISADEGDDNNDKHKIVAFNNEGRLGIFNYVSGGWEQNINMLGNGAVELYYDNVKKFETTSGGVGISGFLDIPSDSNRLRLGASNDLQIYHNGTINYIEAVSGDLQLIGNSSEKFAVFAQNGAVELYYDNSKKFETTSAGVLVSAGNLDLGDNQYIRLGASADLQIYHNGSNSYIQNTTLSSLYINSASHIYLANADNSEFRAKFHNNSSVELYHDGSKKFETTSTGVTVSGANATGSIIKGSLSLQNEGGTQNIAHLPATGKLRFADNKKATFGNSDDLQIYHSGSQSYIKHNGTGNLYIDVAANEYFSVTSEESETIIQSQSNGAVELFYDGSLKFQTTSAGATVTNGHLVLNRQNSSNEGGELVFNRASDNANQWINDVYGGDSAARLRWHRSGTEHLSLDHNELVAKAGVDIKIASDTGKFIAGTGSDLQIYHDGTNSVINNNTGGLYIKNDGVIEFQKASSGETKAKFISDGAVELYYDNNAKLSTTSQGIEVTSNSTVVASTVKSTGSARADMRILAEGTGDAYLWFDASNGDLSGADYAFVQHTNSDLDLIIANYANDVIIKNRNGNLGSGGLNTAIHCHQNGAVELYHDGTKFLETDLTPDTHSQTVNAGVDIGECLKLHVVDSSNCAVINAVDMHHAIIFRGDTNAAGTNVTNGNTMCFREFGDMLFRTGGTNQSVRFTIAGNGNIGAPSGTNIYNASDSRLKKNVVTLDKGLDAIKALRPVSFNWIDGFCDEEKDTLYGFVAQEAQTVDSNLVAPFGSDVKIGEDIENPTQTITDPLRVNEKYVIPMLVKAVQELEAKVAALEAA